MFVCCISRRRQNNYVTFCRLHRMFALSLSLSLPLSVSRYLKFRKPTQATHSLPESNEFGMDFVKDLHWKVDPTTLSCCLYTILQILLFIHIYVQTSKSNSKLSTGMPFKLFVTEIVFVYYFRWTIFLCTRELHEIGFDCNKLVSTIGKMSKNFLLTEHFEKRKKNWNWKTFRILVDCQFVERCTFHHNNNSICESINYYHCRSVFIKIWLSP